MRSICPEHGEFEALIASNVNWYLKAINSKQAADKPRQFSRKINKGCPLDCGLCAWHEKACNIPIVSITNVCNLKCPICFTYIKDDLEYFMSVDEFNKNLNWIIESEKHIDMINIIGGEPTIHPELFTLIKLCKRKEIGRVSLYSNGIKIAKDEAFVKKLAEQGVDVILSFNTFDRNTAERMYEKDVLDDKLKALDNLEKHDVQTTLLTVSVKNLNDKEINRIVDLTLKKNFIRSVTIQNMSYKRPGGSKSTSRKHLTIDEIIDNIVKKAKKRLSHDDFSPLPGSHPLCYSACHILKDGDFVLPLKRLFVDDGYFRLLGNKYMIRPEEDFQQILSDKISEISDGKKSLPHSDRILLILKKMISMLYPEGKYLSIFERQKQAEKFVKTIYIHAPMDEDTFDVSRIIRCGDLVPDIKKTFIPACSYHLFYRINDKRFRKKWT
jgi:uncharacterized radical SAM superfamily Fe-S cluster-containing enzyme